MLITTKRVLISLGVLAGGLVLAVWQLQARFLDGPRYQVVSQEQEYQIRRYEPMVIARVTLSGTRHEALRQGFRILSRYIFGHNASAVHISMTSPVRQRASGDSWEITFMMPFNTTLQTLPKPLANNLDILEIPSQTLATITFSGDISSSRLKDYEDQLRTFINSQSLQPQGPPLYFFYDPPWTWSWLKRHEVAFELMNHDRSA